MDHLDIVFWFWDNTIGLQRVKCIGPPKLFFFQEKICEESASFDLKPGDLATAMEEITRVSDKLLDLCEAERLGDSEHSDIPSGNYYPFTHHC